jgi:hypothetical protein
VTEENSNVIPFRPREPSNAGVSRSETKESAEVIPIKEPDTTSGEAQCLNCNHKWIAVVPAGVVSFECPECHTFKGIRRGIIIPGAGKAYYACPCCHGEIYYLIDDGNLCIGCGNIIVIG